VPPSLNAVQAKSLQEQHIAYPGQWGQ